MLTRQGPRRLDLLTLPDELLLHVAEAALTRDDIAGLNSLQGACIALRQRLAPVWTQATTRRLQWVQALTNVPIVNEGRSVSRALSQQLPWAAAGLLPTSGRTCWTVHFSSPGHDLCHYNMAGVCDTNGLIAWGVVANWNSRLCCRKLSSPQTGCIDLLTDPFSRSLLARNSYPELLGAPQLLRADGRTLIPGDGASDIAVCVFFDHDLGTLAFSCDGGERVHALGGFPRGMALRPWARLRDNGNVATIAAHLRRW